MSKTACWPNSSRPFKFIFDGERLINHWPFLHCFLHFVWPLFASMESGWRSTWIYEWQNKWSFNGIASEMMLFDRNWNNKFDWLWLAAVFAHSKLRHAICRSEKCFLRAILVSPNETRASCNKLWMRAEFKSGQIWIYLLDTSESSVQLAATLVGSESGAGIFTGIEMYLCSASYIIM